MNSNKKALLMRSNSPFGNRPAQQPLPNQSGAVPKGAAPPSTRNLSAVSPHHPNSGLAPQAFRPPAKLPSLQPKMAVPEAKQKPSAPPVYRPQFGPASLQTKKSSGTGAEADREPHRLAAHHSPASRILPPKTILQLRKTAAAPPVYRPEQKNVAQPKMGVPLSKVARSNNVATFGHKGLPVNLDPAGRGIGIYSSGSVIQRANQGKAKAQSTQVILWFGGFEVHGSTGMNAGHAEMDAIDQFLTACANKELDPVKEFKRRKKNLKVQCEAKKICIRCGTVLRALGFKPLDDNTEWGEGTMDMTEWVATHAVREFLAEVAPGSYEKAKSY